ncbi:MAG: cytidylyltransferase domain-containing protein [Anaerolineales bacterium]
MTAAERGGPIVALVPMRHHSERVPGKNYRPVAGRPLYVYILEALQQVSEVSQIVVDTDSPTIRDGVAERFPSVRILDRPESLRGDAVPMNDILVHDAEQVPAGLYLQTHSTNPLLQPATIGSALAALRASPDHDSLFAVTRLQARLWSAEGRPINHDPGELLRTQDLPAVFLENSCLYLVERTALLSRRNRLGQNPLLFAIDPAEAWDIDEEFDVTIAECLIRDRQRRMAQGGAG